MTATWRALTTTVVLLVVSAATVFFGAAGSRDYSPLGYVNAEFTEGLITQLGVIWLGASVTLALLITAVRIPGIGRAVNLTATRVVGSTLTILVIVWLLFVGFLVAIGGGAVVGFFSAVANTGPALALAIGTYMQGRIRSPILALIPSMVVFVISVAATWIAISTGISR